MGKRVLTIVVGAALLALMLAAPSALAAPREQDGGNKSRADQTRAYWTAERIQNARARDMVRDGAPGQSNAEAMRAGGGKPGGGGSSVVTGASWTKPGLVKSATGKVFFHMDGSDWVCSGSVVEDGGAANRSLVLTAGHCVYDEESGTFASYWMFIPDYDASGSSSWYFDASTCPEDKCWVADALVTTQQWAGNGEPKWEEDYAFAVIPDGANGPLDGLVGALPLDFNNPYGGVTWVDAFGYPAAGRYKGADLVYCAGNDHRISDGLEQTTSIRCNMTGGSSGGPWIEGLDASDQQPIGAVRSLTSYSYSGLTGYLWGPIFDGYTEATWNAAKTANTHTLVN